MIIDLSMQLDESTPIYPGDPKTKIKPAGTLEKNDWADHIITFGNHLGTHIDAPSHMFKNGRNLSDYPVEKFVGQGCYINATNGVSIELVKKAKIQQDDIVLINTGISDIYSDDNYFKRLPAIPGEVIDYLITSRIKMLGIDAGSVDIKDFSVHKQLLKSEILIIENLINLHELKNKKFNVCAMPIKLPLDGAPARVVAEVL